MIVIEFKANVETDTSSVTEVGSGRCVGGFLGSDRRPDKAGDMILTTHSQRAKDFAAHLTAEHAGGRVPQAKCGTLAAKKAGTPLSPCDYERVHMPEMLTDDQRASLVMCPKHAGAHGSTMVHEVKP